MKKFVSMLLALVMVFALCACGSKTEDGDKAESIKVGFICLHDENSTYDKNFIDAAKAACKNAGLSEDQYIIKTNIPGLHVLCGARTPEQAIDNAGALHIALEGADAVQMKWDVDAIS